MKNLVGDKKAQSIFQNKFAPFIQEIENLASMSSYLDKKVISLKSELDEREQTIYFFWKTIWDDFFEIILLYSNGYPLGALKILRGMFERTVHLLVFCENPNEIEAFREFAWVDEQKIVRLAPQFYLEEYLVEVKTNYERVKEKFQIQDCTVCRVENCLRCKKTRTSPAWFKKRNIVDMAQKVGFSKELIREVYYLPLQETHPKLQSMFKRTYFNEIGEMEYKHDYETLENYSPLCCSHNLLIKTVANFMSFFEVGNANNETQKMTESFNCVWNEIRERIDQEK